MKLYKKEEVGEIPGAKEYTITDLFLSGELMTTQQVAEKYRLAKRNVIEACNDGRLTPAEAVKLDNRWIITMAGAERIWGYRINGTA